MFIFLNFKSQYLPIVQIKKLHILDQIHLHTVYLLDLREEIRKLASFFTHPFDHSYSSMELRNFPFYKTTFMYSKTHTVFWDLYHFPLAMSLLLLLFACLLLSLPLIAKWELNLCMAHEVLSFLYLQTTKK